MDVLPHPAILCIDHKATDAELNLLRSVLERAGYRVLLASEANRACEVLRRDQVRLILMEQRMPTGIPGCSLAELLKRWKPDVPLAIYTADWTQSFAESRIADAFMTKLVPVEELLRTIERLVNNELNEADRSSTGPGANHNRDRSAA